MRQILVIFGIVVLGSLPSQVAHADGAGIPCTCRAAGGASHPVGAIVCLDTPNGPRLAECGRVLNNTSWTFLSAPCPTARRPGPQPNLAGRGAPVCLPAA